MFFNNEFLRCPIFQLFRDFRPLVYFPDDDEYKDVKIKYIIIKIKFEITCGVENVQSTG